MPYWHYTTANMLNQVDLDYYYFNDFVPKSSDIKSYVQVLDENGSQVFLESTSSPEFSLGFVGAKRINLPFNVNGNNVFPTAPSEEVGYFTYKFFYEFNDFSLDSNRANDTLIHNQVFGTYYAYDDGVAEAGYGVFGSGNQLAYRFDMGVTADTLKGVYLYFSPVVADRTTERFQLTVWRENSVTGTPGQEIYRKPSFDRPKYMPWNIHKGVSRFEYYPLDTSLFLNGGRFFIGWTKVTEERMNIGYDVNTNSQSNIYINVDGVWTVSDSSGGVVPGSMMMRPVFRSMEDPVIGLQESKEIIEDWKIYPNPARDIIYINSHSQSSQFNGIAEIFDVQGKLIERQRGNIIDVSSVENGLYFIRLSDNQGNLLETKKLIVRH